MRLSAYQEARSRPPKDQGLTVSPPPGGEPLCDMATLWVSSRRLPGTFQRYVLPSAAVPGGGYNRAYRNCYTLRRSREPPAYQPIELPSYKAAPLQSSFRLATPGALPRWRGRPRRFAPRSVFRAKICKQNHSRWV